MPCQMMTKDTVTFRVKSEGFRVIARGFEKVQVRVVLQTLPATFHRSARRFSSRNTRYRLPEPCHTYTTSETE